jgi:hypothetical protein
MTVAEMTEREFGRRPRVETPFEPGYRKSWALIIGINYKDHSCVAHLSNAESDAQEVHKLLRDHYDFPEVNITKLIGAEATKYKIERQLLDVLAAKVDRNDRVFIFYAGHGKIDEFAQDLSTAEGYLIPIDFDGTTASCVEMSILKRAWNRMPAKHVLGIVDCCYSGLANVQQRDAAATRARDNVMTQYRARQIITAGRSGERIADSFVSPDGSSQHSYLAHYLVDALEHGIPNKRDITAEWLYYYLLEKVSEATNKAQNPTFGNHDDDRGMFLLARTNIILPRSIRKGLGAPEPVEVLNAIEELERLFAGFKRPGALDRDDPGEIEELRKQSAKELFKLLSNHEHPEVVQEAGKLLATVLSASAVLQEEATRQLIELLKDQTAARVEQAAAVLAALSDDSNLSKAIVTGQVKKQKSQVRSALERAIVQDSPGLTFSALQALVRLFPHEKARILPWLRLKLMDSQADERTHLLAFETLPAMGDNLDLQLIKQALERRPLDSVYRSKATESLLTLLSTLRPKRPHDITEHRAAINVLVQVARFDADAEVRGRVLEAAVLSDDEKWFELLSTALADPSADIRKHALVLLSQRPIKSDQIDVVLRNIAPLLTNEPLALVRAAYCDALGWIWRKCVEAAGGPVQLYRKRIQISEWDAPFTTQRLDILCDLLGKALEDNDPQVRQGAARAFGQCRDVLAVAAIQEYLQRELEIKRMIKSVLVVAKDDPPGARARREAAIQQLREAVPVSFPELVKAYLLLLAGVVDHDAVWQEVTQEIYLIFEAARELGGPELLDLFDESLSSAFGRSLDQICNVVAQVESDLQTPQVWQQLPFDGLDYIAKEYEQRRLVLQALMLAVAYESRNPAFMPLVQLWLRQPPEQYTPDTGLLRAQGELHLLAIRTLGRQPRRLAIGPARELLQRVLASQPAQRPALLELVDCLAMLGGQEVMGSLVELIEAPELQVDEATEIRHTAAVELRAVLQGVQEIDDDVQKRVRLRAVTDPSAEVRQALLLALPSAIVS